MVHDLETAARVQPAASALFSPPSSATSPSPARALSEAIADAVVLSAQARQVINELGQGQTVAEAWLAHITEPPDLTKPETSARDGGNADDARSQASVNLAVRSTLGDLSWLLDAMNPPKVDTNRVAQVLAARMTQDNVGINPSLPEVRQRAEHSGGAVALYVENLSLTVQKGVVTEASVERIALTSVDSSVRGRVAGSSRPVVVDVGGQAQLGGTAASAAEILLENSDRQNKGAEQAAHALLILRQGGTKHPEGTMRLKLDALLPLD